jgi:hypothetical protein
MNTLENHNETPVRDLGITIPAWVEQEITVQDVTKISRGEIHPPGPRPETPRTLRTATVSNSNRFEQQPFRTLLGLTQGTVGPNMSLLFRAIMPAIKGDLT